MTDYLNVRMPREDAEAYVDDYEKGTWRPLSRRRRTALACRETLEAERRANEPCRHDKWYESGFGAFNVCSRCGATLPDDWSGPAPSGGAEPPTGSPQPEQGIEGVTREDVEDLLSAVGRAEPEANVYRRFIGEVEAMTIMADWAAAHVVGELTRAVKRAQMAYDAARADERRVVLGRVVERLGKSRATGDSPFDAVCNAAIGHAIAIVRAEMEQS